MTVASLFVYYFGIGLLVKTGMLGFHVSDIDIIHEQLRRNAIVS